MVTPQQFLANTQEYTLNYKFSLAFVRLIEY
jgi:hypothetical protein